MANHLRSKRCAAAARLHSVICASGVVLLSHSVTPVFVSRYFLPSGIGLAIVLTVSADALGADNDTHSRWATRSTWVAIVLFLMISPVLTVMAVGPINLSWTYLDMQRFERSVPSNVPVIAAWQQNFVKFMRYSNNRNIQYYFLLDWPAALVGPRAFVLDYHLMQAYRDNGYYSKHIQDSRSFLCSHRDFVVLDAPNANTRTAQ